MSFSSSFQEKKCTDKQKKQPVKRKLKYPSEAAKQHENQKILMKHLKLVNSRREIPVDSDSESSDGTGETGDSVSRKQYLKENERLGDDEGAENVEGADNHEGAGDAEGNIMNPRTLTSLSDNTVFLQEDEDMEHASGSNAKSGMRQSSTPISSFLSRAV